MPDIGQNRLSDKEIKKILNDINDPRLSVANEEYFVIDLGSKKRYIPKRTHIPKVTSENTISQQKIEDCIRESLEQADNE